MKPHQGPLEANMCITPEREHVKVKEIILLESADADILHVISVTIMYGCLVPII